MRLPIRLFIILAILFLVIPAIFKKTGLNPTNQTDAELASTPSSQIEKNHNNKIASSASQSITNSSSYGEQLKASIVNLDLSDQGLENCVTDTLSNLFVLKDGKNHIQNAAELTSLDCHRTDIKSLQGIDVFSELTHLSISDNDELIDVSPLARLRNLKTLNLAYASEEIENVDALQNLNNLTSITFPRLTVSFCYQAEKVIKNMQWNHEKIKHNFNEIHCRGKKTKAVTTALKKQEQGKELNDQERQLIDDYEENENWRE